jgi:hypothetical protein
VLFLKNPCFEGKSGGERGDREKAAIFNNNTAVLLELLADDIAEDAAIFKLEIVLCPLDLLPHPSGDDRKSDELRV